MAKITQAKYRAIKKRLAYTELNERQQIISDALKSIADDSIELKQMARQLENIKHVGYITALEIMYTLGLKIIEQVGFRRSQFDSMGDGQREKYLFVTLFTFAMDALDLISDEFDRQGVKI